MVAAQINKHYNKLMYKFQAGRRESQQHDDSERLLHLAAAGECPAAVGTLASRRARIGRREIPPTYSDSR